MAVDPPGPSPSGINPKYRGAASKRKEKGAGIATVQVPSVLARIVLHSGRGQRRQGGHPLLEEVIEAGNFQAFLNYDVVVAPHPSSVS